MRKIKIFFLLISIQIFSSLLLDEKLGSITQDIFLCGLQQNKTKCSAVELQTKPFQCCSQKLIENYKDKEPKEEETCTFLTNPLQSGIDEMATENGKILFKEYVGFDYFIKKQDENITSQSLDISCKDGNLSLEINIDDYTEEEKVNFK